MAGIGEIEIAEEEAANLANAFLQVAGHRKKKIPPEVLAWGNLLTTAATVYAPRIITIVANAKSKPRPANSDGVLFVPQRPENSTAGQPN